MSQQSKQCALYQARTKGVAFRSQIWDSDMMCAIPGTVKGSPSGTALLSAAARALYGTHGCHQRWWCVLQCWSQIPNLKSRGSLKACCVNAYRFLACLLGQGGGQGLAHGYLRQSQKKWCPVRRLTLKVSVSMSICRARWVHYVAYHRVCMFSASAALLEMEA